MSPFDQCPPPALEAEKALLGCLMGGYLATDPMTSPRAMQDAMAACKATRATLQGPADFSNPANATIYAAIMALVDKGTPLDPASVRAELERQGVLAQVNGGEGGDYFLQVLEAVPTAAGHAHHASLVRLAAIRRDEALRLEQERAALNGGAWEPEEDEGPPLPRQWEPFPLEALPDTLRDFVAEVAESVGCDPAFVVAGVLPALAAAIGNSRVLTVKPGWDAPAIVWAAIVAESGTKKSPALEPGWEPLKAVQSAAMRDYKAQKQTHDAARKVYEKEMAKWKRAKEDCEQPQEPTPPQAARCWTSDATIESVADLLDKNPRGLLMARDELAGWFGGFDKYKAGGKGGEAAQWLECFEGRAVVVDRKGSGMLHIPRAAVSVSGGIQPGRLRDALTREHRESGLAARLLFAQPPRRPRVWNESCIQERCTAELRLLFANLASLELRQDEHGAPAPVKIGMDGEAKAAFVAFYDEHGAKIDEAVDRGAGDLAAAFSKLEGYAPRLALVLHLAKWAGHPYATSPHEVDLESMTAGIRLARWYAGEAERLYAMLASEAANQLQDALLAFIRRKGGAVSARDVRQGGPPPFQNGDADPEKALAKLTRRGLGRFEKRQAPSGGRPAHVFVLKGTPR